MLGVFKRRLKPKRAREEKESQSNRKNVHKSEAIVPVDVARIAPSQRQIHPLFEDKTQLLTYDDGRPIPQNLTPTATPSPNLKKPPDDPFPYCLSQLPKRLPSEPRRTSPSSHPLAPTPAFHPPPNICVQGGRIEFVKSPSEGANLASLNPPRGFADNKTRATSLSQYAVIPQTKCVAGVTRAQQTQVDFPDDGPAEEKCDFAKEFLEATIKELQRLLECEREAVQKERLAVTRLQRQLARRDATQRDVDRERRLRADIESRLRETVSESERYRETLAGLQREFSKMEDTVRTMLQYKTRCELLNQERVFLTAIYESRVVQFQNTISKLEQENESLKQRLHLFEKIGTEEVSTELLERLRSLETENAHLFQDADFQRKQYESCLDDIANQVVRALLSQKGLREEVGNLQRRIKELENQNHVLADVLVEKLDKGSIFALPYADIETKQEQNTSGMLPGLLSSEARAQEQSGNSSSSSFSRGSGEKKHRLLFSDLGDKNILKNLSSIESLIVVPLQRPRSLNLHLHTSPVPLSAVTAVTSKQCQNKKDKFTLVTLSKKPLEDEGNESPESGNRDEGYSTMSSDVQVLGETNELSKRELEDLKEASDETDVIADSTVEMTSTAVIEDMSDPDMFFIPLNLSLTINSRQSYPPSKKFFPFQHAMRSFSDSHLFLKLTTTAAAVPPSISPSVLLVDVFDRAHILKRSKPATSAKERNENDLEDSQSSSGSWCSGSWWDTEFFQHWLKLDDTRLKQQQQQEQRDMLQLQYDRTEIEEWSMSLSCEDVAISRDGEFHRTSETPESLRSAKMNTSSPEEGSQHYSNHNLALDTRTKEEEGRWFHEADEPRKSTWPMMSPGRSWGSVSTNNFEDGHPLNDCYFNETRSMDSPAVSEDAEESSAIDIDFTRDFYRLVKFESTKSLASNSSKSNGHCDFGLLNQKQSEFAQEREMALQSVLSFIVEQQKYCHHREEADIECQPTVEDYRDDVRQNNENPENSRICDSLKTEGEEFGDVPEQNQMRLFEHCVDFGVNDDALGNSIRNKSTSDSSKNSSVRTCESSFLKESVNKKTNGSLKKGNHCSAEREITTKLPVRNSKNRNLVQNCTEDDKQETIENFSRSLKAIKSRAFGDFVNQNKEEENCVLNHSSKHFVGSNQKEMSFRSSAQTLDSVAVHSKKTSPNSFDFESTGKEKRAPPSKKQMESLCAKPTTENKIPRLRSDPRIRGTKIPVISCKKVESATVAKPKHLYVESSKPNTLKERDGDTNIPVLAWRCGKNFSRLSLKKPKTPESSSSALAVLDDRSFHEKATSKDVINELNKMIRKGEDLTPGNAEGELKPLDMACCCPTGWVHVERDIDFTDPKARANLLDVMLASSGTSSGSGSSSDSGGDEPVDYTHLHRLHRFRRQRKASATRVQLGVLRYPLTSARPSIMGRENFFVRYGDKEKEAVASFDFLDDISTTSLSGYSSCDSLESSPNTHPMRTGSPTDQEFPSPEIDICTPLTPTTPITPSDDSDKRTSGPVSFSDSCADSYPESVGSLEEQC